MTSTDTDPRTCALCDDEIADQRPVVMDGRPYHEECAPVPDEDYSGMTAGERDADHAAGTEDDDPTVCVTCGGPVAVDRIRHA